MSPRSSLFSQRIGAFVRSLTVLLAYLYPGLLLALIVLLRAVGERFWMSGVLLYLPRWLFGFPLPVLVLAILAIRRPKLLLTQLFALLLLLFPLMGLVLPGSQASAAEGARIRLLTCNGNNGYLGHRELARDVLSARPDIVLLQEMGAHDWDIAKLLRAQLGHVDVRGEFVVGSRYPIGEVLEQRWIMVEGEQRSARFARYGMVTPLGELAIYNVHPVSPRAAFYALRGEGFRKEILSGRLIAGANSAEMQDRSRHREAQVRAAVQSAANERLPVVLAGDFNLPTLSPMLEIFQGYQDGFAETGAGFGYTYPADKRLPPFLRLDRIWASKQLRFAGFQVLRTRFSDHWCVHADLVRAR